MNFSDVLSVTKKMKSVQIFFHFEEYDFKIQPQTQTQTQNL